MIEKSEMIFGVRAVIEAVQAGKDIDKILVKKDIQSDLSKELFAALKGTLIPVQRVPVERINRFTRKNHQGVIAFVSAVTYQKTEDLVPFLFEEGKNPLFVMLDGITDVRNFGLGKFEFFKWNPDKKQKQEQSQGETRRKQDQPVARKQAARKAGKKGMGI